MCLHSCPRAGSVIFLNVIGHFNDTFKAVCSMLSRSFAVLEPLLPFVGVWLKFIFILAMQWSAVSNRFRNNPCNTLRTLGRWTSCNTNRWDWKTKNIFIDFSLFLRLRTIKFQNNNIVECWHRCFFIIAMSVLSPIEEHNEDTYTTTRGDGDLYRVSTRLADFFQVQRFVGCFVLSSINH